MLHNVFYALAEITGRWAILSKAMEVLEVVFFVLAFPVGPVVFLVGTVGAIVLLVRRRTATVTAA